MLTSRQTPYHFLATILFCTVLLCSGCASRGPGPAAQQPPGGVDTPAAPPAVPGFDLPQPPDLPLAAVPRTGSYVETDLIVTGDEYLGSLPSANVKAEDGYTQFTADWINGLSGAAYAIYRFLLEDYDRAPVLRYGWAVRPDPLGTAWIGLASVTTESWHWWQCDESGEFNFGDAADYINPADGALYAAVVVAGSTTGDLRYLRVGPSALAADVDYSPQGGVTPLTVEFDASGSTTPLGSIEAYRWDWDGDGEPEVQETDPIASHTYTAGGSVSAILTVRNTYGEEASKTVDLPVFSPWTHSWGGDGSEKIEAVATDGEAVYAAGYTTGFDSAGNYAVLLLKYGLEGNFNWARKWDGPSLELARDVACDNSGGIFTVGQTLSYGEGVVDALVQRWDADGNLLWTRTWGADFSEIAYGCRAAAGVLYVCGFSNSFHDPDSDALLLAYDYDGNLLYARCFGSDNGTDTAKAIRTSYNFITDSTTIHIAGDTEAFSADSKMFYAQFDTEGILGQLQTWGDTNPIQCTSLYVSGSLGLERYIGGIIDLGGNDSALLLQVAAEPLALSWTGGVSAEAHGVQLSGPLVFVAGTLETASGTNGFLNSFSLEGAVVSAIQWAETGVDEAFNGLAPCPGSGFILGGTAASAAGLWTVAAPSPAGYDLEWDTQTNYFYTPDGGVSNFVLQDVETPDGAVHDTNADPDHPEAFVGIVAG